MSALKTLIGSAALVAAISFNALPAVADEPIDAVDFLVDGPSMIGQAVTISSNCWIVGAGVGMHCATDAGPIYVDDGTLDKEDKRRALKLCTGLVRVDECAVTSISGVVEQSAILIRLQNASIEWVKP